MNSVTFKGNQMHLKGSGVSVGDNAPVVKLKSKDLGIVEVGKSAKIQIVLSVPSLDTPVCATEAREFNKRVAQNPNAEVIVVSQDLPFAMGRFCSTENIDNIIVASDFVSKEFGEKYGVLLSDGALEGLLARAIFVIKDGKIVYKQIVPEVTELPNIEDLEKFFSENGGCSCSCSCSH